jgi:hypothetical protein
MKFNSKLISVLFFLFSISFAHAQDTELAKVKELFFASWAFDIKADDKPRMLKIKEITQVGDKKFELSADYGLLFAGSGPISGVTLTSDDKGYRLTFTTQANSRVDVYFFTSEKNFKGTFSPAKGASQEIVMTKVTDEYLVSLKATIAAKEAAANNFVMPEKISGRWKNNRTGYGQAFSMDKIVVSGARFTANFTQWFDSSCVARSVTVNGEIKKGVATFDFTPPCYSTVTVVLDFVSSTGVYKFGNGGVVGSYEFK